MDGVKGVYCHSKQGWPAALRCLKKLKYELLYLAHNILLQLSEETTVEIKLYSCIAVCASLRPDPKHQGSPTVNSSRTLHSIILCVWRYWEGTVHESLHVMRNVSVTVIIP